MILTLLFLTGFLAGCVDAIAGGGGLISVPVLLATGLPPHVAFGTNKLQGSIGTLAATLRYYKHGLISFQPVARGVLFGIIGGILGSTAWQVIDGAILLRLIPILLAIIFIYTLLTPKLGEADRKVRMPAEWFYPLFGLLLGFYDGFFGPGTGSFWVFALTCLLGYNLMKATAYTKVFNLNSSVIATVCFMIGGNVDYRIGLAMGAGQLIGGRLGATLAITKGARLIRPVFLSVVSMTIASLIYKTYFVDALNGLNFGLMLVGVAGVTLLLAFVTLIKRRTASENF